MSDVLKMVEAALGEAQLQIDYLHRKFQPTATGEAVNAKCDAAITALRGLAWKPLEEMDEYIGSPGVVVGARSECGGHWEVIGGVHSKSLALAHHATHFCRPILPAPPKREVE